LTTNEVGICVHECACLIVCLTTLARHCFFASAHDYLYSFIHSFILYIHSYIFVCLLVGWLVLLVGGR